MIAAWLLCCVVSAPLILRLPSALEVGGFSNPDIEAAQSRALLEEQVPAFSASVLVAIFESDTLTATDPTFAIQAQAALADVVRLPEVTGVVSFVDNPRQISADGRTAYTLIRLAPSPEESQRLMSDVRERLGDTDLKVTLAGAPAFYEDVERISEQDLRRAETIAIPFALLALLLVFGSVVGALVPLVVGGLSVAAVLGLLFVVAGVVDMSIFVLNLTTMLGLGLAIDYSLFMTSRFREELRHRPVPEAVAVTAGTAGRAVFFSGLTVLVGLSGLVMFDFMFLRSVGIAGALVVLVAVVGALTLLPAVLGVVGTRIDRLRIIPEHPQRADSGFWHGLANWVMAHPWLTLLPTLALLIALGLPFLNVKVSSPDATILPLRVESRQGFETLRREFGSGEISPIVVALESDGPVAAPENLAALHDFTRHFAADERVVRIDSLVTLDPRISLAQYTMLYNDPAAIPDRFVALNYRELAGEHATAVLLYTRGLAGDDESKDLLADVRAFQIGGDFDILVDGGTAEIVDVVDEMYAEFPPVAAVIILATYIVLLFLFRSAILPLKAIAMNILSIGASYGALVFIFQDGNFASLLGFEPLGYVEASLPILMFCVLFGLSMDYEVFLLSRVREAYLQTGDNRASVALGLQGSGRIITGAALIVVVVTVSFVSAEIVLVKALGLGIAIAVLLDATIVRALLVPATMRLLGDLNWWLPAPIRRLLPKQEH
ncbi:MAG: MMPL family transporter [Thermomicrobiales bacterium]